MGTSQKRPRPESTNAVNVVGGGGGGGGAASSEPDSAPVGKPVSPAAASEMSIFRPPILRSAALTAAGKVNKALFTSTFDIAAARIYDVRHIGKYQKELAKTQELLRIERFPSVVDVPETARAGDVAEAAGTDETSQPSLAKRKCLLLRPQVSATAPDTWSGVLREAVERDEIAVFPYKLTLDYDHWNARDVLVSILPEEFHDDLPSGFNTAGHVAHLNLRDRFKPYKYIIGQVLIDKNAQLRTVINKIDLVGTESVFRTFPYELLAGPDDLQVEVRENNCTYRFDYSRVYWNSKLEKEHTRIIGLFRPGQAVCDVMAGIGPFAVPAGKRGVFVWANDMNPESYAGLCANTAANKPAGAYVRAFNEDGMDFIRRAADLVRAAAEAGESAPDVSPFRKEPKPKRQTAAPAPPPRTVPVPATISHFVMNLPASAITFLPRFRGVYAGQEGLFSTGTVLPLVHVHCFAPKNDEDDTVSKAEVCARVSEQLGVAMTLCPRYADVEGDDPLAAAPQHLVYVHNVRAVAPNKSMFCASFRLPASVAFAARA